MHATSTTQESVKIGKLQDLWQMHNGVGKPSLRTPENVANIQHDNIRWRVAIAQWYKIRLL